MIEKRNKLEDGEAYSQAETALCIWEHVIEVTDAREDRDGTNQSLYIWFTQHEGVYQGRHNAIKLAHLVDHAYTYGNGEEHFLDGYAFDWELVPFIIETWSEQFDAPHLIEIEHAEAMGLLLRETFNDRGVNKWTRKK